MQVTNKKGIEDDRGSLFTEIIFRYLPYWPLFLSLLLVSLGAAWFYLRYTLPIYESSATILVKDEKKGVDDANLMAQLDLFGSKKLVENEIEVLSSRMLMRDVVKNLALYAPISAKGSLRTIPAYTLSPVMLQVQNPDSLVIEKKVFFNYDSAKQEVVLLHKRFPLKQWFSDGHNIIRFLPNPNYEAPEEPVNSLSFAINSLQATTGSILNGLKITQATKLSSVIDLKIGDYVPKRGENILNGLIAVYNKAAIDDKNALASNTLKFINERLRLVVLELDSVELGIQKYKTREGIVDISAQGQQYLQSVGTNDEKLSQMNVQLAVMDQVEKYVESKSNQPGIVPSTFGIEDPVLTGLLTKLYDLEVRYEGLRKTTAENNPLLVSVQNEIDKIKPNILENVRSLRKNLQAGKNDLTGTSNQYASVLKKLPQKERGLVEISRQQTIKNGIYSFLLQKKEETALSYNSAVADTRIVDTAEANPKPVSPNTSLIFIAAIICAIGGGVGIIAIREVINQNIVFRSEIEQYTTVPVLGEIQEENKKNPIVIEEGRRTVVAEQFRQLRTSLAYIGINARKKKILVTSSISGEGKSFVAANLAISLGLTNKKVVLLEMDLRKPKLSQLFNVSREIGLTNYFIGNKDADHIIKSTTINKNVFIIPSGALPPNPSELILTGRLEELLAYLETVFDYIIIDTAPVNPVTDAYILSPMCDATLYIVRHGVTPKSAIKHLDDNVAMRTLKNMAIIFNGVKSRGIGQYGYGYGYGYGGNYGYEETPKKDKKKKNHSA
jgi:tyrosine-protein kinase Etk/Wzc